MGGNHLIQIASADAQLIDSVDIAMAEAARRSGDWLKCGPGCTQCCLGSFEITQLDAMRLRAGLRTLDAAHAGRLRRRAGEHVAGDDADRACPVLDPATGLCELYEWRPMTCRTFGPASRLEDGNVGACELCYEGATEAQIEACVVEPDPEGIEYRLLDALELQGGTSVADAILSGDAS